MTLRERIARDYGIPLHLVPEPRIIPRGVSGLIDGSHQVIYRQFGERARRIRVMSQARRRVDVQALHARGLGIAQIADALGAAYKAVWEDLKALGLTPNDGRTAAERSASAKLAAATRIAAAADSPEGLAMAARRAEVARLLAEGLSKPKVAAMLGLTEHQVRADAKRVAA